MNEIATAIAAGIFLLTVFVLSAIMAAAASKDPPKRPPFKPIKPTDPATRATDELQKTLDQK